jgi:hypothetical protein
MPRTRRIIRKRFTEGTEVLCSEVEESLLFGYGCIGTAIELRTLEDWRRYWSQWRDTIMPKVIEHRPGTRPFACYVTGEISARPVLQQPPLDNGYFKLYVPASNGTGQWHYRYPEPWMRDETRYLRDLGVVDGAEWQRHLAWRRRGHGPSRSVFHIGDYVLERGLHE